MPKGVTAVAESGLQGRDRLAAPRARRLQRVSRRRAPDRAAGSGRGASHAARAVVTRVKICGVTTAGGRRLAVGARGVGDRDGLLAGQPALSSTSSRRRRSCRSLPPFVTAVGVFVDQPEQSVAAVADAVGLGTVQFHGDEDANDLRAAHRPRDQGGHRPRRLGGTGSGGRGAPRDGAARRPRPRQARRDRTPRRLVDRRDDRSPSTGHPVGRPDARDRRRGCPGRRAVRHRRVVGCRVRTRPKGSDEAARVLRRAQRAYENRITRTGLRSRDPDARGYYGAYGGRFVPETLVAPIEELAEAYFRGPRRRAVSGRARQICCATTSAGRRRSTKRRG